MQVWSGNEDDCREVTWEECNPVEKTVPMSVAKMICVDMPVEEIFQILLLLAAAIFRGLIPFLVSPFHYPDSFCNDVSP